MITKSVYKSNIIIPSKILKDLILIEKLYEIQQLIDENNEENDLKLEKINQNNEELSKQIKKSGINQTITNIDRNNKQISKILKTFKKEYQLENYNNIYDDCIKNLFIKKYTNICNYDGYVLNNKQNKINILKRSCGKILYNADILYNITYIANILMPVEGTLFKNCEIIFIKKNFGFLAKSNQFKEEIIFIVPFVLISDDNKKNIINNRKHIKKIDIITLQAYFEIHDQFIKIIGKIPDNKKETHNLYKDELDYTQCRKYFESFNITKKEYEEDDNTYYVDKVTDEDLEPTDNTNYNDPMNTFQDYNLDLDIKDSIPETYKQNLKFLYDLIDEVFKDPKKYYKYTNNGVTCWMNSSLQFINQIISYKKYILDNQHTNNKLNLLKTLLYDNHIHNPNFEKDIDEITKSYEIEKLNLIEEIPNMDFNIQQDASQAIGSILDNDIVFSSEIIYDFRNVENSSYAQNLQQYNDNERKYKESLIEKNNKEIEEKSNEIEENENELKIITDTNEIEKKNKEIDEKRNEIDVIYKKIENIQKEIDTIEENRLEIKDNFNLMDFIETKKKQLNGPYDILKIQKFTSDICNLIYYVFSYESYLPIGINKNDTNIKWIESIKKDLIVSNCHCTQTQEQSYTVFNYYYFNEYVITRFNRDNIVGIYNTNTIVDELEDETIFYNKFSVENNVINDETETIRLDLRSIICKDGEYNSGHYINISKDIINNWIAYNDSTKSIIKSDKNIKDISNNFNKLTTLALYRVNIENDDYLLAKDMNELYNIGISPGVGIPIQGLMGGSFEDIQNLIEEIEEEISVLLNEIDYKSGDDLSTKVVEGRNLVETQFKNLQSCSYIDKEIFKDKLRKNEELSNKVNIDELYDFLCEINKNQIEQELFDNQSRTIEESTIQPTFDDISTYNDLTKLTDYKISPDNQIENIFIGTQGYEFNNNLEHNYWNKCYKEVNKSKNILDFYNEHFKILEMNSKINIDKFKNLQKNSLKITLVITVSSYKFLNDYVIENLNKYSELNMDITIVLKFDELQYDFQLLNIVDAIKDNNNLNILFEFWDETFYKQDFLLSKIYEKQNLNIVLLDIKNKINFMERIIITEEIFQKIISKKILYIKLYGSDELYRGTYSNEFLNKLKQEIDKKEKIINIIFANVETNSEGKPFIEYSKKEEDITKDDMPSSIINALNLINKFNK